MRYRNRSILLSLVVGLVVSLGLASTASAQAGLWEPTGSMTTPRFSFSATLLLDGKVLVSGGLSTRFGGFLKSAELYDPSTGTWTLTGSMSTARWAHSATLLLDGNVLVAGGEDSPGSFLASAELYDPSTGTWTPTGSMSTPRTAHMAALITIGPLSGSVLVAGGTQNLPLASAELYDPTTGAWSDTGSMTIARYWNDYAAPTLPDGSVLVVGGVTCCPYHWLNQAETYDPVTENWTATSGKKTKAQGSTTLLLNGQVLVTGGSSGTQPTNLNVAAAELFDPSTETWLETARMSVDRDAHELTLLASGRALVTGGYSGGWGNNCNDLTSAELYGSRDRWRAAGSMATARWDHQAILLPNGLVLVVGGRNCANVVHSSAELYRPDGE